MNKHLHRIVFNAKRGQRMVVAETASAQGKAASGDTAGASVAPAARVQLHPLRFAVLAALGMVMWLQPAAFTSVHAQIVAAPGAPANQRPTVLQTANGLPQVNIQTPSAAGVSRNTYSQFDVPQNGAILNNSRTNVQTQLGGFVGANPWLATGPARVILNEVQSANPSQIRGYVEVAGQRAEVIIANPAGINVNGGGFLNASRVTLTTGSPVINGGALDGFRVQGGNITVGGAGLDTSTADYTGILARAVQVNAGIWAKELRVATGANEISADHTSAAPIAGAGAAPAYAIDVAQLGGMYAGKIFLIGTETGLGVRNAGVIAATGGELVLQSNGWLANSGALQAAGNVQANTQGTIANTGTVYANGSTTLAAQGGISNSASGVIAAQGNTSLQATVAGAAITSAAGSVVAAGMAADGTLTPAGNLSVSADGALSLNGQTVAGGNTSLSGTQVNLTDGKLSGQNVSVTATTGSIDASRATVNAQGTLTANAAQILRTDSAVISANQLNVTAKDISNAGGEIVQTGTGNTTIALTSPTGTLNNSAGRIATNSQSLTLSVPTLNNTGGKIEHAGSGTLAINATTFSGDGGIVASTGTVNLSATTLSHNNATLSAGSVNITAGTLSNRSGTINQSGLGAASVTATGAIDNSAGKILSNGNTTVSAQSLNNQGGVIQATGTSSLGVTTTAALDNTANGQIAAGGAATLSTGALNNNLGKVTAGTSLNVSTAGAITNAQGLLASNGAATITAASVDNTRGIIASVQNNASVTTTGTIVNDSGRIEATGDITLVNAGLSNTKAAGQAAAGSITGRNIAINTGGQTLNNAFGTIAAAQGATLQTGALNNNAGLIQAGAALGINTNGQALTNTNAATYASGAGGITSQGVMTLTTGELNNAGGFIGAKGALTATTTTVSNAAAGQIVGESSVSFTSTGFDNQGGQVQALGDAGINAGAGAINNTGGLLRSAATTTLAAGSVINSNTLGANQGIEGNSITITAGAIGNNSGAIRTTTNATLTSGGTLNNTAGLVSAGNTATVQDTAANPAARTLAITNTGGTFVAGRSLAASAASLSGAGSLLSQQDLSLSLAGDFSNTGTISATGNNTVSVTGTLTNSGKLQAGATLDVTATTIDNTVTGEMTGTTTKVTATAANTLINRGLIDGVDTQINAVTLNNIGTGRIYGNTLSIAATTINNDAETVGGVTTAATIAARQRLDIGATTINNSNGALIFSAGDMAIGGSLDGARRATGQATLIKNASATIESLGAMSLTAASIQNTNPSFSYTLTTTGPVSKMDMVAGDGTVYASTAFAWTTTGQQGKFVASTGPGYPVIGAQALGSPYANPVYKAYYEGPNAFEAEYTTPPVGDTSNGAYYPDVLNYQNTDPVWALFGMANPSNTTPGPRPTRTWVGSQDQGAFVDPTPAEIAAWEVKSAPWQALQLKLNDFRTAAQSTLTLFPVKREYTETDQTATVNAGKPAQILSGGNMTLNASGTLLNDNSRIIAGGVLSATAQAVNNQSTQITAVQSRSGSSTRFGVIGQDCFLGSCSDIYGFIVDPYAQNIPHTIVTGIAVSQSNAAVPGTGTVLASLTPGSVSTTPGAIGTPSAAARSAGIVQVTSTAASITSEQVALTLAAGNNANIKEGRKETSLSTATFVEDSDAFSSGSTEVRQSGAANTAIGSSLSGNTVTVVAGNDINVKGSTVVSDAGTTLVAGNNLTIEAATNTSTQTSFEEKKQSGMLDGGAGITVGTREQSTDQRTQGTSAAASTIGSIAGNVTLVANEAYKQVGSDVMAPGGDVTILAKKVDIVETRETSQTTIEQKFKQTGLTLEVTSPVISAMQTIEQMSDAADNTSDGRMKGLAAANAAFAAKNAYNAIQAGQSTTGNNPSAATERSAADQAGGINIAISIGSSESQSNSTSQSNTARGSSITAAGTITIAATGAGADSNLTIQGSNIEAGRAAQLLADNQVKLLAAQNTASQNSTNSNSSGSLGVSFGTDGLLFNASASGGKGKADGADTFYTNTQVKAGEQVSITSGGDTTLQGAVVKANQVKADVGGNLNIASLQDTSTYTSEQKSMGGSISVGYGKMSGSFNASKSNIDSNFNSVGEQSGIKAGDGGFQVNVAGNTSLNGSVIASNQAAVEQGKNSFSTGGTLTIADIQNVASYTAKSVSISVGSSQQPTGKLGMNGLGLGLGSDKGDASSTSSAGISGYFQRDMPWSIPPHKTPEKATSSPNNFSLAMRCGHLRGCADGRAKLRLRAHQQPHRR